jgi:alpha-mannosidase
MDSDVPANSWALALPAEGDGALMVATRTKYGFRGTDDTLAVSLIRSSYDPDPLPEVAIHRFSFAVSAVPAAAPSASIIREVQNGNHPLLPLSGTVHAGTLPTAAGFAAQDGNEVLVSAYKLAEDGSGDALLRVYECDGKRAEASFTFARAIRHAAFADINERPVGTSAVIKADGNTLCFEVGAYASATVRIKFA